MDNPPDIIAELEVIFEHKDGKRIPGMIYIGKPHLTEPGFWECPVGMQGLYSVLADGAGVNSLQALCAAIKLAQGLSAHFLEQGGKILETKNEFGQPHEHPFAYNSYFRTLTDERSPPSHHTHVGLKLTEF